ncbi:porin [Faucicola boevrei]|uniref:porin n=1 Tax=Faucicola boevrei TaxID=346665 RepID=UPI000378DDBC|nr:porin [Moraxella boevrei]
MKKLLLATAVAALSVSAQAAPQVYGKAFLTLDYVEDARTQLNSNSSRIGIKGSENLTANTDLVYQLEYGVDVDAGDNWVDSGNNTHEKRKTDQFYSRDTYLGLSNKQYGTLVAGRLTTIDDQVNYVTVAEGLYDNSFGGASWDGPRANNAMAYFSPDYNGVQFLGMYALDEDNKTDSVERDAFGVGVKYEPAGQAYRGGATYIQAGDFKTARVSGQYDVNQAVTVGGLYQNTDTGAVNAKKENIVALSGQYKTGTPWLAYGEAHLIQNMGGVDGVDSTQFVVGGKYNFNQATTGHVYVGHQNVDSNGTEKDGFGVGAGLEYNF